MAFKNKDAYRTYYEKNRERMLEHGRKYREKDPDRYRDMSKKRLVRYRKTPKSFYNVLKCNAKRRGREFLSQEEFLLWYADQPQRCHYCGIPTDRAKERLSIDRKDADAGYIVPNIVLACLSCNKVKSDILTEEEMLQVGKLVMRKRWHKIPQSV